MKHAWIIACAMAVCSTVAAQSPNETGPDGGPAGLDAGPGGALVLPGELTSLERTLGGSRRAVIVGVGRYPALARSVTAARERARGLAGALLELGYTVELVSGPRASQDAVISALEGAARTVGDVGGTLIFGFGGHCLVDGQGRGFLVLANWRPLTGEGLVPFAELGRWLVEELSPSGSQGVAILDCGGLEGAASHGLSGLSGLRRSDDAALTQPAALSEALRGGAADDEGIVRLSGLAELEGWALLGDGLSGALPLAVLDQEPAIGAAGYELSIETEPADARVRIATQVIDYAPGMRLAPGRYLIEVTRPDGQVWQRTVDLDGDLSLFVSLGGSVAGAAGAEDGVLTRSIGMDQTRDARLQGGEAIWSAAFEAGARPVIRVSSEEFDTVLELLAPDGTLLASDDDGGGGTNSQLRPGSLAEGGRYSVVVRSYGEDGGGRYRLSVTAAGEEGGFFRLSDEALAERAAAGEPAPMGIGVARGRLEDGRLLLDFPSAPALEVGPEALTPVSDADYRDALRGQFNPGERVRRVRGDVAEWFAPGVEGTAFGLTLEDPGVAFVQWDGRVETTCDYPAAALGTSRPPAAPIAGDCPPLAHIMRVAPGGERVLAYGDMVEAQLVERWVDSWSFAGQAGDRVRIRVPESSIDTVARLIGPDGEALAFDDDSGGDANPLIDEVPLTTTGIHHVQVRAYDPVTSGRYTLSIVRLAPASAELGGGARQRGQAGLSGR